jgi:phosphoglycerol transferase MdoB-like AlkP superfamily enzyme
VLTRLGGAGHDGVILAASAAVLLVASVAIYRLFRRAAIRGAIPAAVFAAGLALALPVNLHLHLQDALVWVLPLVLLAAHARAGDGASEGAPAPLSDRFEVFALSWPLVFVLTSAIETAAGRLLPIPPPLVLAAVLIVWTRHRLASLAPIPPAPGGL